MSMCDALCSTPCYNSTNSRKFHRSTIKGVVIAIDYVESITLRLHQGNLCHQPQDSDEPLKPGIMVSTNNWAWPTGMQLYTATNTSKTAEHPSVLDRKKNWRVGTVGTHGHISRGWVTCNTLQQHLMINFQFFWPTNTFLIIYKSNKKNE